MSIGAGSGSFRLDEARKNVLEKDRVSRTPADIAGQITGGLGVGTAQGITYSGRT